MAATATLISLEQYLRTSYKPDRDYVNGELEERNVGEFVHSRIQGRLAWWFTSHEEAWAVVLVTEQRITVSVNRARVCDVCLLRADAPREPVTVTPPVLCIEILSPEDRLPRATVVLEDYRRMGVENTWLIDPLRRVAYTLGPRGLELVQGNRIEVPNSPIYLDLDEIFKVLD